MGEIQGLQEMLYGAMQAYSSEVAGSQVTYDAASYPYFFDDAGESFAAWTPRLAKAAYNYQVSQKDPGEFAHGGKYIIQLLYDSIESLNEALSTPVDLSAANRIDHGHFAGSEEAFRHWDEDGAVPGSCSRCHSAEGLPLYIEQGVSIEQPTANGLNCATCHNDLTTFTRYESESVEFPSGATLSLIEVDAENGLDANLCLNCHQGRESTVSVDRLIGDLGDDELSEALRFLNIHYFAAGASLFGNEAQGAYQYEGKEYLGRNEHVPGFDTCVECHDTHALEVKFEECGDCHEGVASPEDLQNIRISEVDFDGDGDVTEGIAGEIETMREALLLAMQEYAAGIEGVDGITYNSDAYPYFFNEAEENYSTWTPALLRAAYNYQYATKDPGGFAHNGQYILQALYDSLEAIGGDVSAATRP
ncbi:MAG TPA: polyheme membrane-associated cytochrome C [Chloroflexi bacterium]|nr:polyheme membrane-associated cytochrome C [Chloroflexota bacterium]